MSARPIAKTSGFGTLPVFLATISTILGAVLFLRFGYAIAHVGFWGTIAIIVIGHVVTISTAMAVAEIATNQKVEGGGAYFMISRSFGLNIGAAIGIALFLAQAISVAFYVIAFAEAFGPFEAEIREYTGILISDPRMISIPTMVLLTLLIITKGANVGVKALYVVVAILFVSLAMFFMGHSDYHTTGSKLNDVVDFNLLPADHPDHGRSTDSFFYVFTIIFPAFTGIAAGLGLSGDLRDPKRAIPLGTMSATIFGMIVYVFIALKLSISVDPLTLATNQLAMSEVALWGPIIPIGLACACISSALGSIMIAPRTLQALGSDRVFPGKIWNESFSRIRKRDKEPVIAGLITCAIGFFFIAIGDVNFVAEIISMFFMVTYGAICLISFLEHMAANPAYRPTFRSRWWISLLGACLCFWLMFKINYSYAILSLVLMTLLYIWVSVYNTNSQGLAAIFKGVIFQISRRMQVYLQKKTYKDADSYWHPSAICISQTSFERYTALDLLRWIGDKYGFGTYIHYIPGYVSKETAQKADQIKSRLIELSKMSAGQLFLDTIISPSYTSAIAQIIQLPGFSGQENNMIIFEFPKDDPTELKNAIDNFSLLNAIGFDVCIIGSAERGFGYKREIHIWLTSSDFENGNLMILLGYIILGHKEWRHGDIKLFAVFKREELDMRREELRQLVKQGRLPISPLNIEVIAQKDAGELREIVNETSGIADLTIIGFRAELLKRQGTDIFTGYDKIGNVLFVNAAEERKIE